MQKYAALFLLFAVFMSFLASCSGEGTSGDILTASVQNDSADITSVEETSTELTDGLPSVDMDGFELSMLNFNEEWLTWSNTRIIVDEMNGDVLNDAYYIRRGELEERFNCYLKIDEIRDPSDSMKKNVTSGDSSYDIYFNTESSSIALIPYAVDWNSIQVLQLDKEWWNPAATDIFNISGKQIALAGNIALSTMSRSVCMVFNKNIYSQYLADEGSLYEIVSGNEWTLDKYLELVDGVCADLNGDGIFDKNDLFGLNMGRGFKGYIASFLCGSEVSFASPDSNGDYAFTLHKNERGIDIMQKLVDQLVKEGYYYNEDKTVHGFQPADFFSGGHALFTQGVPHDIYKLRDMEDDIGIVPIPKYDEKQEKYCSAAWGGALMQLSKTYSLDDSENIGIILEALSFSGYYDIVPQYKEIALKTKTARDNESSDMLDIIFSNVNFDFGINILYDAILADTFLTDIWNKKSSDIIVSSMEKALPKITNYIDNINENIAEME